MIRLRKHSNAIGQAVLSLLYPPQCMGCGQRVAGPKVPICPQCVASVERATAANVHKRLERLEQAAVITEARSLWVFDAKGALQSVQHALKYEGQPQVGHTLGRWMAGVLPMHWHPDGLVPVPLHRQRWLERGYNQSMQLARGLSTATGIPACADVLQRTRPTRSQTGLERTARWKNVARAFEVVRPERVAEQTYVVIDDVLTTGSTAAASAQALIDAGAARVYLCTLGMART